MEETRKDAIKKKVLGTDKQVSIRKYALSSYANHSSCFGFCSRVTAPWQRSSQPLILPFKKNQSPVSTRTEHLNHQDIARCQLPYRRTFSPGRNERLWQTRGNSEWPLLPSLQRRHHEVDGKLGRARSHWKRKGSVSWLESRRNVLASARASHLPPAHLQVRCRPSKGRDVNLIRLHEP